MKKLLPALFLLLLLAGCNSRNRTAKVDPAKYGTQCKTKTSDKDWYTSGKKAPLLPGLEGINFKITTSSPEAQQYFNQGMMLSYGFNHAEAARSFYEGTKLDSTCAMCWWGFAYVLGPNYNAGMEPDNFERAYEASQKALSLLEGKQSIEKQLINALTARYAKQAPEDRHPLDVAYNQAMKKVYDQFPNDPDVGALYAESLMDLHPWDMYDKATKKAREWTPSILAALEHLMKQNPKHPGAHHFYIHALEASAEPERALESAKLLTTLVPGAGHLVHMPSHIYINTGHYHLASLSNMAAVKVDSVYTTACHAQGAYPLAYYPHNYHFLAATATLEGNSKLAWMAANKVHEHTAQDVMAEPGWGTLQHYYTIPYYVAVKLGMWDSILAAPKPADSLVYPNAVWHYARGMAYLGKKDVTNAVKELNALVLLSTDTTLKTVTIWEINTTYDLVQIASKVLSAEVLVAKNETAEAVSLLKEAIAIEDRLNYDEPPDWFFSVRHYLGELLLNTGKYADAEKAYREDLKTFRENGWALAGLYQSLLKQKKDVEAKEVKKRFDEAWQYADIKLLQ